jgi:aerobic-type carbon monoxide dehydrogenase small subunit (CoxS/CutS family)
MDEQPTTPLAPEEELEEEVEGRADADGATPRLGRRGFLRGLGGSLATATLGAGLLASPAAVPDAGAAAEPQNGANGSADAALPGATASVTLTVNGTRRTVKVDPRRTLLEMLRSDLDLTGTKLVCDHGSCGACTVLMDGRPVYSCMTLALDAEGKKIDTVEGLAKGEKLHPLQAAFVEHDALMCGFCTPGFLMSSKALLDKNPRPTLEDVKNACAGNLCRCGTYPRIFEAVLDASNRKA